MKIYSKIAHLLNYPSGDYHSTIDDLYSFLDKYANNSLGDFGIVAKHFTSLSLTELQEYYISTFDVNASCYLDVGYVLFGEESKRSQFLLHMKSEQITVGNDCGTEFPDHLPNMLTLIDKTEDEVFKEELVFTILIPALKHMIDNFKTENNPYQYILRILVTVFEKNYPDTDLKPYVIETKANSCVGAYSCGMDFTRINNKRKLN